MEATQILELMDYFWFERQIFGKKHTPPKDIEASGEKSKAKVHNLGIRSYSDRCIGVDFDAESPRSVMISKQKLQKIPSGEEVIFENYFARREKPSRKKKERGMSRSLSALEFEELKGFMDLGFEFNEEETNPSIVSIVPGLQTKWKKTADANDEEVGVSRPYLSEAWGDLSRKRDIVMNLRIPYGKNHEMDIKHHLKLWAHVVASTVR